MATEGEEREKAPSPAALEPSQSPPLEVMSEVHVGCPPNFPRPFISHFTFSLPHEVELMRNRCDGHVTNESNSLEHIVCMDEDGDLIVSRRTTRVCSLYWRNKIIASILQLLNPILGEQSYHSGGVTIQHNILSTIPDVGLQVWRAELILADYVLHKMFTSSEFDDVVAVELGAGTGLVGILLARAAEIVFITDHGDQVLDNCARNIHTNSGMFRSQSSVRVRELDWLKPWPPLDLDSGSRYSWKYSEVEEINRASVLLAADVIYSDELTDALFSVLEKLMCQGSDKVLYLALEKRYNFSLDDLDVVASGYSHFCSYLRDEEASGSFRGFEGRRIDLSGIPQYVREYERGSDVELWEIKYVIVREK